MFLSFEKWVENYLDDLHLLFNDFQGTSQLSYQQSFKPFCEFLYEASLRRLHRGRLP